MTHAGGVDELLAQIEYALAFDPAVFVYIYESIFCNAIDS